MTYDNPKRFRGHYGLVTLVIKHDDNIQDIAISKNFLNKLAVEVKGNKSISISHYQTVNAYYMLIPELSEHHGDVLKDLGYNVRMVKLSRNIRKTDKRWLKFKG